jgi:hypothetical protein
MLTEGAFSAQMHINRLIYITVPLPVGMAVFMMFRSRIRGKTKSLAQI